MHNSYTFTLGQVNSPTDVNFTIYDISDLLVTWNPPYMDNSECYPKIHYCVCQNLTNMCICTRDASYNLPSTYDIVEFNISACYQKMCSESITKVYNDSQRTTVPKGI